jgi:hypothetical protein
MSSVSEREENSGTCISFLQFGPPCVRYVAPCNHFNRTIPVNGIVNRSQFLLSLTVRYLKEHYTVAKNQYWLFKFFPFLFNLPKLHVHKNNHKKFNRLVIKPSEPTDHLSISIGISISVVAIAQLLKNTNLYIFIVSSLYSQ